MKNDKFMIRNKKIIIIFLWMLVYFILLISFLNLVNHECISYDESFNFFMMKKSFTDIYENLKDSFQPPLYFFMLKFFTLIFGNSIYIIRIFSIIGTILLITLGMFPVRRILGNRGGFIYSILILIFPIFSSISIEGSHLSWTCFFVTGSVIYGYIVSTDGKFSDWIKFSFFTLSSCYIEEYSFIAIVILNIIISIYLIFYNKKILYKYINALIIIILFLPWYFFLYDYSLDKKFNILIFPVTLQSIWNSATFLFSDKLGVYRSFLGIPGLILVFMVIYTGTKIVRLKNENNKNLLYLSMFILISIPLMENAVSLIFKMNLFPDYIFILSGILVIGLACCMNIMDRMTILIICLFFLILSIPQNIFIRIHTINGPMNEINSYLKKKILPDDIFLYNSETAMAVFMFYYPQNKHYFYYPYMPGSSYEYKVFGKNSLAGNESGLDDFMKFKKNVWLVNVPDAKYRVDMRLIKNNISEKIKKIDIEKAFKIDTSWIRINLDHFSIGQ